MPRPQGEDILLGMIDATLASRRKDYNIPHRDFKARIQMSAAPHVVKAAQERGLSVSAYIRRAALAFAAHDLGLDLAEVLKDEPQWRLRTEGPRTNHSEGGEGHGNWQIKGLK